MTSNNNKSSDGSMLNTPSKKNYNVRNKRLNGRQLMMNELEDEVEDDDDLSSKNISGNSFSRPTTSNHNSYATSKSDSTNSNQQIKTPNSKNNIYLGQKNNYLSKSVPSKINYKWDMPNKSKLKKRDEPYNWQEILKSLPSTNNSNSSSVHNSNHNSNSGSNVNSTITPTKKRSNNTHSSVKANTQPNLKYNNYYNNQHHQRPSNFTSNSQPNIHHNLNRLRTNSLNNNNSNLNWQQQIHLTKNNSFNKPHSSNNNLNKNLKKYPNQRQKSDSDLIYAGAAFHNSPAPTDLPPPTFL